MNATLTPSLQTRLIAFAVAALTSTIVLGSTVAGMQPHQDTTLPLVALERVTIVAPAVN